MSGCAIRTRPRRRGSDKPRAMARRPRAVRRTGATTRSTASASCRNIIRVRRGRSRRSVPAIRRRRCTSNTPQRLSVPPSQSANKTPIPPAMAGTVVGQPLRKRLRVDDDPFGAVGDYAGSFLIKSALELSAGYDTNPRRTAVPGGSPFYVVAPEFLAVSDWERHALVADLRGSFTGYGNTFPPPTDGTISSAPVNVDRPDFTGHVDGRLDVTSDTRISGAGAAAGRDRQSRQPEHPGRSRQVSGLCLVRRHLRCRPELQPPADLRRRHRRPHRVHRLQAHRRHVLRPTTTATSTSSAASAASATT